MAMTMTDIVSLLYFSCLDWFGMELVETCAATGFFARHDNEIAEYQL